MPRESVLTDVQTADLEIEHFIFHVIHPDQPDAPVTFLDEVVLTGEQKEFFTDRLRNAASGSQYLFMPDAVSLKEKCQQLLTDRDAFIEISRQITQDFAGHHTGNTANGVLVIAIVKTLVANNQHIRLVFLVKLDHKDVYQYTLEQQAGGQRAVMHKIANSLVEDKAAVQKSALIDVSDVFAWDVLAAERRPKPDGEIWGFYKAFLGVQLREDASTLTRKTLSVVRKWARGLNETDMPEGEDVNTYKNRAIRFLEDSDQFDTERFLDLVVRDEVNAERKLRVKQSLGEQLAEAGIAGQTFRPQPNSLLKKAKRMVYETVEGVRIQFEGSREEKGITIRPVNGGTVIEIRTARVTTKDEG